MARCHCLAGSVKLWRNTESWLRYDDSETETVSLKLSPPRSTETDKNCAQKVEGTNWSNKYYW